MYLEGNVEVIQVIRKRCKDVKQLIKMSEYLDNSRITNLITILRINYNKIKTFINPKEVTMI